MRITKIYIAGELVYASADVRASLSVENPGGDKGSGGIIESSALVRCVVDTQDDANKGSIFSIDPAPTDAAEGPSCA